MIWDLELARKIRSVKPADKQKNAKDILVTSNL